MGHQYYARLSGSGIDMFRLELSQPVPDRRRAADAATKATFFRAAKLLKANDIPRIHDAVCAALRADPSGADSGTLSLKAEASVMEQIWRSCRYPDEAAHTASELMRDLPRLQRDLSTPNIPPLRACLRAATIVAARQVTRPDIVIRLPKEGFLGIQHLAADLAAEVAERAFKSIDRQYQRNPESKDRRNLRAPRASSPRRSSTETGDIDVG